jgi:hypothetical protein
MNTYGNPLPACSGGGLHLCNSSKPKTMTMNLIARKTLFRLSAFCKRRADFACRRGHDTRSKLFLMAWEKLLDTRDKLR